MSNLYPKYLIMSSIYILIVLEKSRTLYHFFYNIFLNLSERKFIKNFEFLSVKICFFSIKKEP